LPLDPKGRRIKGLKGKDKEGELLMLELQLEDLEEELLPRHVIDDWLGELMILILMMVLQYRDLHHREVLLQELNQRVRMMKRQRLNFQGIRNWGQRNVLN
jgi:hypothetical protein